MKRLYFLVAMLMALVLFEEPFAAEIPTELTLVVGSNRAIGGISNSSIRDLVGQEDADFTHTQSFKGRVVSISMAPLRTSGKYEHLRLDFLDTSSLALFGMLNSVRPNRVFFEWFPSCVLRTRGKNFTPVQLPALRKAYEILSPGGELLIDHLPYVLSLATDAAASRQLSESGNLVVKHVSDTIATLGAQKTGIDETLKEPGVISRLLQEADPFTLHICKSEHEQIRNYLMFRRKNPDAPFDDSQSPFIKGNVKFIDEVISLLPDLNIYGTSDMMALVSNGMKYYYYNEKEEQQGYWHLFEWGYYMKTRRPLILKALCDIGFIVDEDAIRIIP